MLWLIVGGGWLGALGVPLLGVRWPRIAAAVAAAVPTGLLVLLGWLWHRSPEAAVEWRWAPALDLAVRFRLDGLGWFFGVLVLAVGLPVAVFAGGYTRRWGRRQGVFLGLLLAFMAAMLGLVLADHLITLYLCWELTTVLSFLLIGFESEEAAARRSALRALLVTGAGGVALLGGLLLLGRAAGAWTPSALSAAAVAGAGWELEAAFLLVALGAAVKSAQYPFHSWLTGAMVAPTPVSAYLHSATMVKAGLFVLARLHPALSEAAWWEPVLLGVAGVTLLVASVGCVASRDLKAVLAYSTIGALAVALGCLAVGTREAVGVFALFLLAHALYKGALFMVAGGVQELTGRRDLFRLGRLGRQSWGLTAAAVLAAVAMAEVGPELSYIAKEMALETAYAALGWAGVAVFAVGAAAFTVVAGVVGGRLFFAAPPEGDAIAEAQERLPARLWGPALGLAAAGCVGAFFPDTIGRWFVDPVAQAVLAAPVEPSELALWHGWKWPVAATGGILALGAAGSLAWPGVQPRAARIGRWILDGPERLAGSAVRWAGRALVAQRDFVEHGRLPVYVLIVLLGVGVATVPWVELGLLAEGATGAAIEGADGLLALFVGVALAFTVRAGRRSGLIAALSFLGLGLALIYLRYSAAEVALAHVLVETLMVVLLAAAMRSLPSLRRLSSRPRRVLRGVVAGAVGTVVTLALWAMGAQGRPSQVAPFYLETVAEEAHRHNAVAAVISDFRALDTLGEVTVLAAAAIGVFHLVRPRRREAGNA